MTCLAYIERPILHQSAHYPSSSFHTQHIFTQNQNHISNINMKGSIASTLAFASLALATPIAFPDKPSGALWWSNKQEVVPYTAKVCQFPCVICSHC